MTARLAESAAVRIIVLRAFFVTLALFAAGVAGVFLWARTSLPDYDGTLTLNGPEAPITITRDRNAVPHIRAKTAGDGYYALGFVHAQDRLWQLEMHRRIAAGELAEILGEPALGADIFMRTLGIRRAALRAWRGLDPETQMMLTRYSDGINAYLSTRKGALPPEFLLLQTKPQPWTPVDCIAWLKMMAWDLSSNWRQERTRLALLSRLSPEQVSQFLPPYPGDAAFTPADPAMLYPGLDLRAMADQNALLPAQLPGLGSNNWAVNARHSASGKPLLANDPHLGLTTPSLWYLARLEIGGRNIVGATMAGLPLVVLGRNDHLAWGFTTTAADVQDLYIERLAAPDSYQTETGARLFITRSEIIAVRGRGPVTIDVRASRHGPILSDALPELAALAGDDHVIALRWVALDDDDTTMASGRRLMNAATVAEGIDALRDFVVPMQNILMADDQGGIAMIAPGRVPVRDERSATKGMMPARGWTGQDEWIGWIPFDALPRRVNPQSGMLASANEKIVGADYPYYLTHDWTPPFRAARIDALLSGRTQHDIASFQAMQHDVVSLEAAALKARLVAVGAFGEHQAPLRAAISDWDGAMHADAAAPVIYIAWVDALEQRLFADELGPLFARYRGNKADFMVNVLTDPALAPWCDNNATPATETCGAIVAQALDDAIAALERRHGRDWRQWRWGDAHVQVHQHQPMNDVPGLKALFTLEFPQPGGPGAINVAYPGASTKKSYNTVIGPSFRAIYDLAELGRSVYVIPTGQSGNALSPHYRDFADKWQRQDYVTISTDWVALESASLGRLTLSPDASTPADERE